MLLLCNCKSDSLREQHFVMLPLAVCPMKWHEKQVLKVNADDVSLPDLGSAFDWSCHEGSLLEPSEALPRSR